jgi:probable selenium-dependent hydroxylase accessory protein YqeC
MTFINKSNIGKSNIGKSNIGKSNIGKSNISKSNISKVFIAQPFINEFVQNLQGLTCIIGGGGKTTGLYSFLQSALDQGFLSAAGACAQMFKPPKADIKCLKFGHDFFGSLENALKTNKKVLVYEKEYSRFLKLGSLSCKNAKKILDHRINLPLGPKQKKGCSAIKNLICECDGSKGMPFKAFKGHEPAIDAIPDNLIIFSGLEVFGPSNFEQVIFRPEIFRHITGAKPGQQVEPEHIFKILNESNCRQIIKQSGLVYIFFNKLDNYIDTFADAPVDAPVDAPGDAPVDFPVKAHHYAGSLQLQEMVEKCSQTLFLLKSINPHIKGAIVSLKKDYALHL